MTDLFLDEKVLNYTGDKYELVLLTMRWARTLKAKGSPEPLQALIEKSLKEIVNGRLTADQIIEESKGHSLVPPTTMDDVIVDIPNKEALAQAFAEEEEEEKKKSKKKKK
jgi:DNA-directed RNA polymerase subunit K/omega